MMMIVKPSAFILLSGAIFALLNFGIDYALEWADTPPIRITSGHIDPTTATVKAGTSIRVVLHVRRDRLCHTAVARYIHSPIGDVVSYQESVGGDAPIGQSRYAFSYPVPDRLAPGRYSFRGIVNSSCGDRRYVEATPALTFIVSAD